MRFKKLFALIPTVLMGIHASAIEQIDGVYQIGTAEDMTAFAELVNGGSTTAHAVLTADIDFSEFNVMLGARVPFAGILDGKGHSITVNISGGEDGANYVAFIREMSGGTVENLVLKGSLASASLFAGGIVGHTMNNAVVRNVVSELAMTQTGNGATAAFGGFVGHIENTLIENCIFSGSIQTMGNSTSGVTGWAAGLTIRNCAVIGEILVGDYAACMADTRGGDIVEENFYYKTELCGPTFPSAATQVTDEQIRNGELCYLLNQGQEVPAFCQTLGEDAYPVPMSEGHKPVFLSGQLDCAGKIKGDHSFNNEKSDVQQDEHEMEDGVCIHCGYVDSSAAQLDEEGFFQLATAEQLHWFMNKAIEEPTAKARLTADIDFSGYNEMLGAAVPFAGTFDGQGYSVTLNLSGGEDGANYVAFISLLDGGTVENLVLKGSLASASLFAGGIVGHTMNNAVVRNVVSELAMSQMGNGAVAAFGGFVGHIQNTLIENCIFAGSIQSPGNSTSGVTGWADGLIMRNCAVIGDIQIGDYTACMADSRGVNIEQENFYYKNILSGCSFAATQVTDEQIRNGELAILLNGVSASPVWFQNVGEDAYPVPFQSHALVLPVYGEEGVTYLLAQKDDDVVSCVDVISNSEKYYAYSALCSAEVSAQYESSVDEILSNVSSRDELWTAYLQLIEKKADVKASIKAYKVYTDAVEYAKSYIEEHGDELEGMYLDNLKIYLEDIDEPSSEFPYGTYQYIVEERSLSDEEVLEEAKFVELLLKMAIENGYTAGADITNMLVNAHLDEGTNGWDVEGKVNVNAGFGVSNGKFHMSQQVQGIQKEGIYAFMFDGYYKGDVDSNSLNFTSYIYANDMCNYVFMPMESSVEAEEEVIDLNRNIILANVTGNELKVGVQTVGEGSYNETLVSDFQLYYLGTMDEASEAMDDVLQCMAKHADCMTSQYEFSFVDYYDAPNFSQSLKDELLALMAEQPSTAEEKYALIGKYSDLFRRIFECKKAYAKMMSFVDKTYESLYQMTANNLLSTDQMEEYEGKLHNIEDAYEGGLYTVEETVENTNWEIEIPFDLPKVDGIYQISNAEELARFCTVASSGYNMMNAVLTNDIDFTEYNVMLGNGIGYAGTLNGQGHTVTINISGGEDGVNYVAFVRELDGGTIENLILKGNVASASLFAGGIVGHTKNNAVVRNVVSEVAISQIGNGPTAAFGGFVGHIQNTLIENCIFAGSILSPGNSTSGVTGWAADLTMRNCAVIGDIEVGNYEQCFADARGVDIVQENFFYKDPVGGCFGPAAQVSEEQILDGTLCQRLNKGQNEIVWYQNVGVDKYPMPMQHGDGVESVAAEQRVATGTFDLSGRKVEHTGNLQRGIYVIDGKKVFVK